MSNVPKASENLHAYKNWRKSITALPIGTIIRFDEEYAALTLKENIKPGQHFKVMVLERGFVPRDDYDASKSYELQLCTKNGVLHAHKAYWSVEAIAAFLADHKAVIVTT